MRYLIFGLLILVNLSCDKRPPYLRREFSVKAMPPAAEDIMLPVSLFDKIEEVANYKLKGFGTSGDKAEHEPEKPDSKGDTVQKATVEMAPLKVFLIEKTKGILGYETLQLDYPKGGGELDLRDYVQEKQGSFYVVIEFGVVPGENPFKIFYLSNAQKRKLSGDIVGAGCNKYFDISSYYKNSLNSMGFLVNTTNQRDVSALAGSYFFATKVGGKRYMAQLTIKDSRHRQLLCRR